MLRSLVGSEMCIRDRFYAGPKRDVEEWIYMYRSTAQGVGTYKSGSVRIKWNIMKVPPTEKSYTVVPYIATQQLSILYSVPSSIQIAGIWGQAQTASDWKDFNRITYIGSELEIPEYLQKSGDYTLIY